MRNEPKRSSAPAWAEAQRTNPQYGKNQPRSQQPPRKSRNKEFLIYLCALATALIGFVAFLLLYPGKQEEQTIQTPAAQTRPVIQTQPMTQTQPPQAPDAATETAYDRPVETEAPREENPYARYSEGDILYFGTYEQDGNYNTDDPIAWRVLDEKNGRLLLISEKALDCRAYHGKDASVTWESSDLREWLNGSFYRNAFTAREKELILLAQVPGDDNSRYNVDGGAETRDYIFIPSVQDMERYFRDDNDRMCWPTAVAVQNNAYQESRTGNSTWWLLRTPGDSGDKVANINCDGVIDLTGSRVESPYGAIRIMLWISTEE